MPPAQRPNTSTIRPKGAKKDAGAALATIKPDGLLIFNDYVWAGAFTGESFGAVPIVNDLVVSRGWFVIGFASHPAMFCDIALSRTPATTFWSERSS